MNVLLVEDHALVRDGLRRLLGQEIDMEVREAADAKAALEALRRATADLVILDLNLPGLGGLELLRRLVRSRRIPVLVLSMHAEPLYVSRALEAGAAGYVSKNASPAELLSAVRKVARGGRYIEAELAQALALQGADASSTGFERLSARDLEILRLLAKGRSLGEISASLGLSYKTIANTLSAMKAKVGATNTAALVRIALEAGVC